MEYRELGKTGINVSRLCFGSLTIGPLQANLPLAEGAGIIRCALEAGVNFIDTAELYGNYQYIREGTAGRSGVVVASKCYAYTREGIRASIGRALRETGRDMIDIFLLHEQESEHTIAGHWEAVEEMLRAKRKGYVRAVGISTHSVRAVRAAASRPEFDVIHPLINVKGIGIRDGTAEDMKAAILEASLAGKGLYGMKCLGGGALISMREGALAFALSVPGLDSLAVGMQSAAEVGWNVAFFERRPAAPELDQALSRQNRRLHVEDWCSGCGRCIRRCGQGAISLAAGKAVADLARCRLCGYCAEACPDLCIKII